MISNYKFLDFRFNEYKNRYSSLISSDELADLKNQEPSVIDIPCLNCDTEIESQCLDLLEKGVSPLSLLCEKYPEQFPVFDYFFCEKIVNYYENGFPESNELLERIIISRPSNIGWLVRYGILNLMLKNVPNIFNLYYFILKNHEPSRTFFANSGAIYTLAFFSDVPDFQLVISKIFSLITLTWNIDLCIPLVYDNSFNCPFNENLTYFTFFHNLLFSSEMRVCLNMLGSIDNMIYKWNDSEKQEFQSFFFDEFTQLINLQNDEINRAIVDVMFNFEECLLTPLLLSLCLSFLKKNEDSFLFVSIYFIEKNLDFVLNNIEIYFPLIESLFFAEGNASFNVTCNAVCLLSLFASRCPSQLVERLIIMGYLTAVSDFLKSDLRSNYTWRIICGLNGFLEKARTLNLKLENDNICIIQELINAIQPFVLDPYDRVATSSNNCLVILNEYLNNHIQNQNQLLE